MARVPKNKLHYIGVRERWVRVVLDLINEGLVNSGSALAKEIDSDPTQVNRIIQIVREGSDSKETPTHNMIVSVCLNYNRSAEWIMTGKGAMKIRESDRDRLNRLDKAFAQIGKIITSSSH